MHPVIAEDVAQIIERLGGALQALSGQTVLVTGASGMLPAYLVDTLAEGNRTGKISPPLTLHCLTRRPVRPSGRLGHLLGRPDVQCATADVGLSFAVPLGVTVVIHAASWATPRRYLAQPLATMDGNVVGIHQLLDYGVEHPLQRFLFFSSGEVYGHPSEEHIPTPETYVGSVDPIGPRSCYAEAKRYAECLAVHYHRVHGLPAVIARIAHSYGPGQPLDDGRVVASYLGYALAGHDITVHNPEFLRTFLYVADATVGILSVLLQGTPGEAYNVGGEAEVTMRQFGETVAELFGRKVTVVEFQDPAKGYLSGAPPRVRLDTSKLRALGWAPEVPLAEGLKRYRAWLESLPPRTA